MNLQELASSVTNKVSHVSETFVEKWNKKSPSERAKFVTLGLGLTLINPVLPIAWAGVYTASTLAEEETKADSENQQN